VDFVFRAGVSHSRTNMNQAEEEQIRFQLVTNSNEVSVATVTTERGMKTAISSSSADEF
jgi:hypothetical protein